jgi:hypothetical protein
MNLEIWFVKTAAGIEWSASHQCPFAPREVTPPTYSIGGWTDPQSWSECSAKEKNILSLLEFEFKFLRCPACSIIVF